MSRFTFWVVRTPKGDRPYVSINKPQSYIDHLDESGEEAQVHTVEVSLPEHSVSIMGFDENEFVSLVKRVR